MVATIIDVAKKCGYSKATVSRAFASPEAVSERAKARIYAAANELNYTPNPIARAMARQKTDNITFVIHENQYPAILNPFYSSALEAIMQETMKRNYGLFVTTNDHVRLPSGEVSIKKHMDGVIIAGQTDRSSIESFCKQNIPVVVLNNLIQMEHLPCIAVDNYHGAKCAAEHLIQKGHRRIALLEGRFSPQIYHDRHNGYMDAIVSAGLTVDPLLIRDVDANELCAETCAREMLSCPERPTALLCTNDTIAVGAMKAAMRMGLRIPEDVAVIGFDDSYVSRVIEPELTTVRIDSLQMGKLAVEMLFRLIDGDAILMESDTGYTALLDGGGNLPQEFEGDPYRVRCAEYLRTRQIHHIDALLISHIHEDHVCGLLPVLKDVSVGAIYVPYPAEPFLKGKPLEAKEGAARSVPLYTAALNSYREIISDANAKQIPVHVLHPDDQLDLAEDLKISVLAPKEKNISDYMAFIERAYDETDMDVITEILTKLDAMSNHTSFLLRIEAGDEVFLTAADSCPGDWDEVDISLLKNVTVLKLPHHGQVDSISEQFMGDMPLRYVITTASSDRRYRSANAEVYERLLAMCPANRPPQFLFTDERSYPPYFHQPDGFQAITLVIDSGSITPEFIKFTTKH